MGELKKVTLTVITYDDKILLGMKKRGFGKGKWNGFGGKPNEGEELLDCVIRETQEEAEIILKKEETKHVATLDFHFLEKPEWDQQVHVFKTASFNGEPAETEEMLPKIFKIEDIPYEEMWPDDKFWLPEVLEGKKVKAKFSFHEDGSIADQEMEIVH